MACPAKPVGAFTPARKTLASTSTSNVFQSFGLNAVEAGAGNIDTKAGAGPAARPPPGAPPARPALGGGGGRLDSQHGAARARQRLATADAALRVDRDGCWRRRPASQRRVNAFDPARALLAPQHDAGGAFRGAPVRAGDLDVLVTRVDEEPAAVGARRRADDLAVLRPPLRLADLIGSGQRGSFEGPVRNERGGTAGAGVCPPSPADNGDGEPDRSKLRD